MSTHTQSSNSRSAGTESGKTEEFVTFTIAGQLFGIPVLQIQDVLKSYQITRIPLAPPEITGSLNLRGRVVTGIDVRTRLGLPAQADDTESMSIVAENGGELYSLMVDSVGEVLALPQSSYERNLPTLDTKFRAFSDGIYRLDDQLLVVLDVNRMLEYDRSDAA
jgi:purine-binding chemotaxis protein CheW